MKKKQELQYGISNKQMKKIYKEKFAAQESPGRKYYDILISAPKRSICPICGDRIVRNLDHYMPQSSYSTLVVTPENLIPTCRDCNFDKHAYLFSKPEDAPLHPYFDNINDDVWLFATLQSTQVVLYEVRCPSSWSDTLKARAEKHLTLYGLNEFYATKAGQEIADEEEGWKEILNESSEADLLSHLIRRRNSIDKNNLNSWKAALYRGLVDQFTEVINWLS